MALTLLRIQQMMKTLDNWAIEGATDLVKEYNFSQFKESVTFVNKVAELAEKHGHHPSILINYTLVRLTLTTHSEHGLTEKDFDLAKAIDEMETVSL